ncbi:MAG: glycine--tRNA ligase [Patescibacteria group bacterium]
MEKIIALCKRRGFVYQGSEIYGGLAGTWDYGPLGVALKNNIENIWWKRFVLDREDMYGMDAAILMNQNVWKASGHVGGFADPLSECKKCKHRFRTDHLAEENKEQKKCPDCDGELGEPKQFNMMFKTHIGAMEDDSAVSYLRPETAGGMFVNFKNVLDSFHPKLPFGMAQIGKAFRNEIAPRDFIFRVRELEQMEIEYFIDPKNWKNAFEEFRLEMHAFAKDVGLEKSHVHELEVADGDRAHYSKRTIDFEFDFPFGRKELYGLAYRTDFDLKAHSEASKADLSYFDEESKERFIPHVIEPSFGVGRTMLAVLSGAYTEDELGGEPRTYLKFNSKVAPVLAAVFPLLKNKPELVAKAREVYSEIRKAFPGRVMFDDNGNIGKRYRRQDEIGTPYCITVDFDTIEKDAGVTIRNRDTGEQERKTVEEIISLIKASLE